MSPKETCMCFGIACGDGWYDIIDTLCNLIQARVNSVNKIYKSEFEKNLPTIIPIKQRKIECKATQVKEKFGGLRFYIVGGDDYIRGLISYAELLSYKICNICGNNKKDTKEKERGWEYTKCNNCKIKK
jgi:hypothetical protein